MQPDRIPAAPLILGLAGTIPFLWGAATVLLDPLAAFGQELLGPRLIGPYVQLFYGAVILSFMGGALWGFATNAAGRAAAAAYAFAVVPALWAFLFTGGGPASASIWLILGFLGILGLDWAFQNAGLAPPWWLRLRLILTAVVVPCLAVTAFL